MSQQELDRNQLRKDAIKESAIADMKQHADKLIRGFEEADETHSKRAIWELIQNARDLSDKSNIEIQLNDLDFSFTHNGKPFTSKTLLSLIKQVSSKTDDKLHVQNFEPEVDEVGQYGTGFITTHSFGKRFKIKGSLKVADETYIELDGFEIDRKAANSTKLAEKLVIQQEAVFDLLEKTGHFNSTAINTTFTYIFEEDNDRIYANNAFKKYTQHFIPLVMALNSRIKSITLIYNTKTEYYKKVFEKGEIDEANGIKFIPVKIEGDEIPYQVYFLNDLVSELTIILPLKNSLSTKIWEEETARLFLYFPLIGTENWGSNFIVHCGKFSPTDKRDGLHLKSNRSQTKEKEESNRVLLDKASDLIFGFVKSYASKVSDPINLARIAFQTDGDNILVNEYNLTLKQKWVSEFKEIGLVETRDGLKKPSEAVFLSKEFIKQGEYWDSIYSLAQQFWNLLPKKEIAEQWTEIITEWDDKSLTSNGLKELAHAIETAATLDSFEENTLIKFYEFLIFSGNTVLFEQFALLPNIKNKFVKKLDLFTADAIHPVLVSIADIIVPDVPQKFINKAFVLSSDFTSYTRRQLAREWNTKFTEITPTINEKNLLPDNIRNGLIKLCSTFPNPDNKGLRGEVVGLTTEYYKIKEDIINIPNIEDDTINYDAAVKCLVRNFLYSIYSASLEETDFVSNNIGFIKRVLKALTGPGKSLTEDIIKMTPIFPDQNFNLKVQDTLLIEEDMPSELKTLYYNVFKYEIGNDLVLNECSEFLPHQITKPGSLLSKEMNIEFEKTGKYAEILKHPYKLTIFEIMKKITGNDSSVWINLFPVINSEKEMIMMSRVTKQEVKDSMFSILDLEDNEISALGDLAKDENMIRIIELGKDMVLAEQLTKADFDFKHGIGVHIENLLRQRIGNDIEKELLAVRTVSQQGGQDIIIFKDQTPVFYIEVKSKWSSNSVTMSRFQMIRSALNPDIYALCVVNMVGFNNAEEDRHYPSDITVILDRIKSVTNIGYEVKPLIEKAILSDGDLDAVKLTGEYRAIIPQKMIIDGIAFDEFMNYLFDKIRMNF